MKRVVAVGLSIVPGAGQVFRGHTRRGLAIFAGVLVINDKPVSSQRIGEESYLDREDRTGEWVEHKGVRVDEELDGHRYATYRDPEFLDGGALDFPESGDSFTVPEGTVFALGDNRDHSYDSRSFGPVPLANVKGKALFVWWSQQPKGIRWDRIGKPIQ